MSVLARIAASSRSPTGTLPPVSIDGDALVADDEADIGDVAQVFLAHQSDRPGVGEDAGRDLLDRQGSERRRPRRNNCGERQNYDEKRN